MAKIAKPICVYCSRGEDEVKERHPEIPLSTNVIRETKHNLPLSIKFHNKINEF
jgi:wyosine [tRNA(Phe)-imidazoG37] synthetase (radical SAM superfamily)